MNIEHWLDKNIHLTTEGRPSLEHAVISTEGFFDLDRFRTIFGKPASRKGTDYKPVEQKHTYNNKALITVITRFYGNAAWLEKQRFVKGNVDGHDILPYFVMGTAKINSEVALKQASDFYLKTYKGWQASVKAYYKAIDPAIKILGQGLTDDNLTQAQTILKQAGDAPNYFTNAPTIFPIMSRRLPRKEHSQLKAMLTLTRPTKTQALSKEQVKALVSSIVETLAEAEKIRETIMTQANKAYQPSHSPTLYRLAHSSKAEIPKGSSRALSTWVDVAKAIDPAAVFWSAAPFTTTRTCYSELVLALCKWIDRSIL